MQWISHVLITGAVINSCTEGNVFCTAIAMGGSLVPDVIEGLIPENAIARKTWKRAHRRLSHWVVPHIFIVLVSFIFGLMMGSAPLTLNNIILAVSGKGNCGVLVTLVGFSFIGAILHIGQDALCGKVPSLNPSSRIGLSFFKTGSFLEGLVTAAVLAAFVFIHVKGVSL
jgi:inner membrane protein